MLSPGNPYVLPSVLVAAGAYLAATLLTDASLLVRIGVLVFLAGVVPVGLNRLLGGGSDDDWRDDSPEEPEGGDDGGDDDGVIDDPREA